MADVLTKEQRHKCMSNIKGKDTKPELIIRKFLFSKGLRFRLHRKDLEGNPDIVLPKYKTVIFVNGCFVDKTYPKAYSTPSLFDDIDFD